MTPAIIEPPPSDFYYNSVFHKKQIIVWNDYFIPINEEMST
jgi:hypothetical protein